jgi:hypothetical protein
MATTIPIEIKRRTYLTLVDGNDAWFIDEPFHYEGIILTHDRSENRFRVSYADITIASGTSPQHRTLYWSVYNHLLKAGYHAQSDGDTTVFGAG